MKSMKKRRRVESFKKIIAVWTITAHLITTFPSQARADFWGGDLPMLVQIVNNTLQQLTQLRGILGNAKDTLGFLQSINEGIREAMTLIRTMNQTIRPGVFSQYQSPEQIFAAIQDLYGKIPKTPEARVQRLTDQSVAEAVTIHNLAFAYADQVDPEAERIKDYARGVSPAGAGKLTAQSLGVLINVTNQLLRTNAAMLKVMSENLALQNRHEKIGSEQFRMQYEGLSSAIGSAPSIKASSNLKP